MKKKAKCQRQRTSANNAYTEEELRWVADRLDGRPREQVFAEFTALFNKPFGRNRLAGLMFKAGGMEAFIQQYRIPPKPADPVEELALLEEVPGVRVTWNTPLTKMGGKTPLQRLQELVPQKLSGPEIVRQLSAEGFSTTRSGIGSKVHHIGLKLEGGSIHKGSLDLRTTPAPHLAPVPENPTPAERPPTPYSEPPTDEDEDRVTRLTVKDKMCRWPIGDPSDKQFHFCPLNAKKGYPYCEEHTRKAYQPRLHIRARDMPRI